MSSIFLDKTKIALTNLRRYVVLRASKNCSTNSTSFNEYDVLSFGLTKVTMVKYNTKMSSEKISEFFEYF